MEVSVREAVIVSTARTGLAKSGRGGFNMTHGAGMAGHAIKNAIARAGIEAVEVEDVFMGCANPEGATGFNIARPFAIRAGCPGATAGPQRAGRFDDEIVPLATKMKRVDRATGAESIVDPRVDRDECPRPDTTLEGLAALKRVFGGGLEVKQGKYITAGNASQFSDG